MSQNADVARGASLTRNVLANWMGQFTLMVSGFIVPRLISDFAGRDVLGVWDLGWSLISFCLLLTLGVMGAVTRYVAHYRSIGDREALSRSVSSALVLLCGSALLTLVLSAFFAALVPGLIESANPELVTTARWVVWILGISAAIQYPGSVFSGVLAGVERFDLRNGVRISASVGLLGGIAVALWLGYGVITIAWLVLVSEAVSGLLHFVFSRRCCPDMRISTRHVRWSAMRDAISFGGKSTMQRAARSGLYEINKLILTYFLAGPTALAGLAIYSRQRSLVMIAYRFMAQYAHVFIPASSALHARNDRKELVAMFYRSTSLSFFIVLPIVAVLVCLGNPLMRLWMGPGYEQPLVLTILALGHATSLAHEPTVAVLMGMNRHGPAALAEVASTAVSVALGLLLVGALGWEMTGAALAVALPVTLFGGLAIPVLACRTIGVPAFGFLGRTISRPLAVAVPFAIWLVACAQLFPSSDIVQLLVGLGGGSLMLAPFYWRWVLPTWVKRRVARHVGLRRAVSTD